MTSEAIVVGAGTRFPLNGLLTLPDGAQGPVPAVVFVHGSGASDMDEKIYRLRPFKDMAEGLAARGIASLRYDKRTFAHAKALRKTPPTAEEETIVDAILAATLLRADARIDPGSVFLVGHSMGAMLGPRIDAEGGDFRGLVLLAGSPKRMEEIVVRQLAQAGRSKGGLMKGVVALEEKIFAKKFDGLYEMPEEAAKKKKFAGGVTLWYFREMGRKTAADYLLESDKPVLIAQGEKDFQVLPEEDFAGFKELLKDRPNTQYRLYDGLNHLFMPSVTNDILKAAQEYRVPQHVDDRVVADVADFIKRVCASA